MTTHIAIFDIDNRGVDAITSPTKERLLQRVIQRITPEMDYEAEEFAALVESDPEAAVRAYNDTDNGIRIVFGTDDDPSAWVTTVWTKRVEGGAEDVDQVAGRLTREQYVATIIAEWNDHEQNISANLPPEEGDDIHWTAAGYYDEHEITDIISHVVVNAAGFHFLIAADETGGGTIASEPEDDTPPIGVVAIARHVTLEPTPAWDAIERLLLAHALAGVDVTAPAYVEGLATTLNGLV